MGNWAQRRLSVFYLVRHAHADWTPDENRPLSARGYADAERVADILHPYPIGAIYSSPFRRARETVVPLATRLGLRVRIAPELRERRLGHRADQDFLEMVTATWCNPSFAHPSGESNAAAQRRGLHLVHRLQERRVAEHIVLSTHGNLMALILQGFDAAVDLAFWKSLTMPDIYTLRFSPVGEPVRDRLWPEIEGGG